MPTSDVDDLFAYLKTLDAPQLAAVLDSRPDALTLPWPAHLAELAERLSSYESTVAAYYRLPRPHAELLGALTLVEHLDQPVTVANVAEWLGTDSAGIEPILEELRTRAMAWKMPDGQLTATFGFPVVGAALGELVRNVLEQLTVTALQSIASKVQVTGGGRKTEVIGRLVAFFRDGRAVRSLVDSAPPAERELLRECAATGADVEYFHSYYSYGKQPPRLGHWSVERGLLVPEMDNVASMPLEVTLALRGDQWRLPFHPVAPTVDLHPVPDEHVAAAAAAQLLRQVELVTILLDHAASAPIPLLKSGEVGVRTVRALAKEVGAEDDQMTLAMWLATRSELLEPAEPEPTKGRGRSKAKPVSPGLVPASEAAAWRDADTQTRAEMMLAVWWQADSSVLMDTKRADHLGTSMVFKHLRHDMVSVYAGFPPGQGTGSFENLLPLLGWRAPLINADAIDTVPVSTAREAELLGVLALGAVTSIGRALIEGEVAQAITELVSEAHTEAVIGADLTAVVFGPPSTQLSRFLDSVAVRESRGAAALWRFTPASVRSAFDHGMTRRELLDQLASIAQSGIPQPLEYLIGDVARTHGSLGVIDLGCVVVADDTTLLLEVAANRKLAKLGLWALAPTVVGSRADAATTLAALRGAGYAPVQRDSDGALLVTAAPAVTAAVADYPARSAERLLPTTIHVADPDRHARHLVSTAERNPESPVQGMDFLIALKGRGNPQAIWQMAAGRPVRVIHDGRTHLVHSALLIGRTLMAWSATTDRYEEFSATKVEVSALQ